MRRTNDERIVMSSTRSPSPRHVLAVIAVATCVVAPAVTASAGRPTARLVGRAILAAETVSDGPPSGAALAPGANGIALPRPAQPVIGISAIVDGGAPGVYLAMPDNGFGTKANSPDFLLRAYRIGPDFETASGGSGEVEVGPYVSFRDPRDLLDFDIVNEGTSDRLLTGGDADPESMQIGRRGDLWVGDEFGPWILHFDADGVLLDAPFEMPGGLRSPANPWLGGAAATQPNSRGLEAMAITPNRRHLYPILEGATVADGASTRRLVFEFDTVAEAFTGRQWEYRTEDPARLVADAAALDDHRLVVIERDNGSGATATFRKVYVVDLRRVAPDGSLVKREVVDLTAIADPDLISLPERDPGDIGLGDPFQVACESIEAVHVLNGSRLLLGCDNNLPNRGRNPIVADDTEFVVVEIPGLASAG
jgi:glycerophosphoryl diester phosphodiesterase